MERQRRKRRCLEVGKGKGKLSLGRNGEVEERKLRVERNGEAEEEKQVA